MYRIVDKACHVQAGCLVLTEWHTDGYPIASGREQEEGLVDLPWYGFTPPGDEGYIQHLSESCCPCYFGILWSPEGQFEARYSA